jgi:hypothetical protein
MPAMGNARVTGFLPEEWQDFAALVGQLVAPGVALYRWAETSTEDGARARTADLVPTHADGPPVEALKSAAVESARELGYRLAHLDDDRATTFLTSGDLVLRIGQEPFPTRMVITLNDKMSRRGAEQYPAIEPLFRIVAACGAAKLASLWRFAELDPDTFDHFNAPRTEMVARGAYDATALCDALARAGFQEDGDVWVREPSAKRSFTDEVRLRDGEVHVLAGP